LSGVFVRFSLRRLENLTKSMIVLVFQVYEDADKMDKLMDRQALLQDKIDALGLGKLILN
jgi:hypothetical protein